MLKYSVPSTRKSSLVSLLLIQTLFPVNFTLLMNRREIATGLLFRMKTNEEIYAKKQMIIMMMLIMIAMRTLKYTEASTSPLSTFIIWKTHWNVSSDRAAFSHHSLASLVRFDLYISLSFSHSPSATRSVGLFNQTFLSPHSLCFSM